MGNDFKVWHTHGILTLSIHFELPVIPWIISPLIFTITPLNANLLVKGHKKMDIPPEIFLISILQSYSTFSCRIDLLWMSRDICFLIASLTSCLSWQAEPAVVLGFGLLVFLSLMKTGLFMIDDEVFEFLYPNGKTGFPDVSVPRNEVFLPFWDGLYKGAYWWTEW